MTTKKKSAAMKFLDNLIGEPMTFAGLVRSCRESEGMSQTELGAAIGVSRAVICDIEKGRRNTSMERAAEIADALGMARALFVQQSLQDKAERVGLNLTVSVEAA